MTRVLYIEDDEDHRMIVENMLTSRGFTVTTAKDGVEGLEKTKEWQPDIILLDLYLPRLDGFGFLKQCKEEPLTEDIPIVIISAWPTGDNRKRVQEAGAVGFIAKPFNVDELVEGIREVLPQAA
jgi:CheY-like chemotaxis protein